MKKFGIFKEEIDIFQENNNQYIAYFDDVIAKKIIADMKVIYKKHIDEIVIHCDRGKSRSPAIAYGINKHLNLNDFNEKDYEYINQSIKKEFDLF